MISNVTKLKRQLILDTDRLATPSGRRVGQPGHQIAIDYLLSRMKEIGLQPFRDDQFPLTYKGPLSQTKKTVTFTNLVGVAPGADPNLPPILLGAHYDSVLDGPCADDNATSVALNLAIAEMAIKRPLERDLIIALFDAEEPPYFHTEQMGSTRFYKDYCTEIVFAAVIVTDLIGHDFCLADHIDLSSSLSFLTKRFEKTVFMTGAESDRVFANVVQRIAKVHSSLAIFPTLNSYIGNLSDHHAFEKAGHPYLFFSCGQGRYYHHERDNLAWINFQKLTIFTSFLNDLIQALDHSPAQNTGIHETLEFELSMIRKAIGVKRLKLLLHRYSLEEPQTREDLDLLMTTLISTLM